MGRGRRRVAEAVLAVAVFSLAGPAPGSGQSGAVGARVGLNAATVQWSATALGAEFENVERRRSGTFGGFVELDLPARLSVRLEGLWSGKGFSEGDPEERVSLDLDYVEIPLLLARSFSLGSGRIEPEIYAGPWVAFEVGCQAGLRTPDTELDVDCDDLPADEALRETNDWGVAAGVALRIDPGGAVEGLIDLRYSAGLRNVDAAPEVDNFDLRNRYFGLTAGLRVPFGASVNAGAGRP